MVIYAVVDCRNSISHQFGPQKADIRTFLEAGLPALLDLGLAFAAAGLLADLAFALPAAAFAATFTVDKYPAHKQTKKKTCLLDLILRAGCLLDRRLLHGRSLLGSRSDLLRRRGGFLDIRGLFCSFSPTNRCLLCRSSLLLRHLLRRTLLGGLSVLGRVERQSVVSKYEAEIPPWYRQGLLAA
jgi:hypothetical protein